MERERKERGIETGERDRAKEREREREETCSTVLYPACPRICRRHVLRFIMSSPLGCHLHICSTINFVFGEEERVMAELTKVGHNALWTANCIYLLTRDSMSDV